MVARDQDYWEEPYRMPSVTPIPPVPTDTPPQVKFRTYFPTVFLPTTTRKTVVCLKAIAVNKAHMVSLTHAAMRDLPYRVNISQ